MNAIPGEAMSGHANVRMQSIGGVFQSLNCALVMTLSVAVGVAVSSAFLFATTANAADKVEKKEPPKASAKVGTPLKAAIDAVAKKEFDVALKKIQEAEAFDKKTPYDQFQIDEIRAYLYTNQGINFPEVITIYEKSLATPEFLAPDALAARPKQLALLAFNTQNYPKCIEYGKGWIASHPDDRSMVELVGKAQYLAKDYPAALASMESLVASSEAAAIAPQEIWLQLVSSCASQLDDQARIVTAYERLVRYYPKADYWDKLLERAIRGENNEMIALYIFRLMAETGVMSKPDQFLEYAQLATDKAMPAEAYKVLESGFERKILGVDAKEKAKQERNLADAKTKAQADRAQLPEIEKEAQNPKATAGNLSAGLGLAYFSFGMNEQAVAALDAGIKKGGLKNIDDYRMVFGIAQLRSGQKEAARATFQSIPANSPFVRVAKLWAIRTYN